MPASPRGKQALSLGSAYSCIYGVVWCPCYVFRIFSAEVQLAKVHSFVGMIFRNVHAFSLVR